jgi:hypothetical protein
MAEEVTNQRAVDVMSALVNHAFDKHGFTGTYAYLLTVISEILTDDQVDALEKKIS